MMLIHLHNQLPAYQILKQENIFALDEPRAAHPIPRLLKIILLNLMPTKVETETQFLRFLGSSVLPVEVTLMRIASRPSKHTPEEHLRSFYKTFAEIRHALFDGLIITGAPVEQLPFGQVDYWEELTQIMDWAGQHVFAHLYVCWAAQAALYHQFGIPKYPLPAKQFGVFEHRLIEKKCPLLRGFDDTFYAPHSRHTEIRRCDLEQVPEIKILAESDQAGVYLVASRDQRRVYITGHCEYDPHTLQNEYQRDRAAGLPIAPPENFYPGDDPQQPPNVLWRAHSHLLFSNWLNACVYQAAQGRF
jgi:homoserine O-succinyltransferase